MPFLKHLGITASTSQAATYFLCVCLFSISFLVFLNSAISFVITDRIGQKHNVGDAVGTLGFADELLALVACPLWGVLSDRIGVRAVAVAGYTIVGLALAFVTLAKDVYPQLLLVRLFFALGGSATSTMVTAILPAMTQEYPDDDPFSRAALGGGGRNHVPSISSEVTITPTTNRATLDTPPKSDSQAASYRLAGFVGVFTGLGALVALFGFLPLPARFQAGGQTPSHAVALSFLIVSIVALLVAVVCFSGLANLPGEGEKSLKNIFHDQDPKEEVRAQTGWVFRLYPRLLIRAVSLGVHDVDVGLAYVGGLVARASSVAISLFIPLFVNAYFISSGRCSIAPGLNPHDPSEIKKECRKAYIVAAKLTGTSQMVALLCAPLFGYLSARYKISNAPLLIAAVAGVAGNAAFARLKTPDPAEGGGIAVYFIVMLIGIGQIGAIVCSLGLLARGIHTKEGTKVTASNESIENEGDDSEAAPLMQPLIAPMPTTRAHLKGSIAGVYSLAGGAGILLLTKVGGLMFDKVDTGSPFYIMSLFNAMLLLAGIGAAVVNYCSS